MSSDKVIEALGDNGFRFIRTDQEIKNIYGTYDPASVDFCKQVDENNHVTITRNILNPGKDYGDKTKWVVKHFNSFGGYTFYSFDTNEELLKYLEEGV